MELERLTEDKHGRQGWRLKTDKRAFHDIYWVDQLNHYLVYQDSRQKRQNAVPKQTEPELIGIYEKDHTPTQLYRTCLDFLRGLWEI